MHAFFRLFWPISLISSRWACEVEPQAPVWVGCSKPSCFTRFWAGSGCGRLAGGRAWGALGASPGAPGSLWAIWVPLGGGLWGRLGASGLSGGLWVARRVPQEDPKGGSGRLLGASGGLWASLEASLGASGNLWGLLGASGGLWGSLGALGGLWVVFCRSVPLLTRLSILTCFPFPALPGFQKAPGAAEAHRF